MPDQHTSREPAGDAREGATCCRPERLDADTATSGSANSRSAIDVQASCHLTLSLGWRSGRPDSGSLLSVSLSECSPPPRRRRSGWRRSSPALSCRWVGESAFNCCRNSTSGIESTRNVVDLPSAWGSTPTWVISPSSSSVGGAKWKRLSMMPPLIMSSRRPVGVSHVLGVFVIQTACRLLKAYACFSECIAENWATMIRLP